VQTRKVTRFPVVLMGSAYWAGLLDWMRRTMLTDGKIGPADLDLVFVTDDPDEAVRHIQAADAGLAHAQAQARSVAEAERAQDAAEAAADAADAADGADAAGGRG
jgi:predicted Rossmann-fold nucleotide-binding protein